MLLEALVDDLCDLIGELPAPRVEDLLLDRRVRLEHGADRLRQAVITEGLDPLLDAHRRIAVFAAVLDARVHDVGDVLVGAAWPAAAASTASRRS